MRVNYDHNLLIAGIGVVPWTRLGLERWFPAYKIATLYDGMTVGLAHMPPLVLLSDARLSKVNTQQIVETEVFKNCAAGQLADYRFLTYKPVAIADEDLRQRFLMVSGDYGRTFENKAWLRQHMAGRLPFPDFKLYQRADLRSDGRQYNELVAAVGAPFILQHEQLSGGKGTYKITSLSDFLGALDALPLDGRLVVSRFIDGAQERSAQCCVTKYGNFAGPLQKQIVRNPYLCNFSTGVVNAFCGAEVGSLEVSPALGQAVAAVINAISSEMASAGFKGIYGIDFLVQGDKLYVLEVNARLTGVTPLLSMLYRPETDIPLYLLHALELGGYDYTIETETVPLTASGQGSLLILQSLEARPMLLAAAPESGVYVVDQHGLRLLRKDASFIDSDRPEALLVQQYAPTGSIVKPGVRVAALITRQPVLNTSDQLTSQAIDALRLLYDSMLFEPVGAEPI